MKLARLLPLLGVFLFYATTSTVFATDLIFSDGDFADWESMTYDGAPNGQTSFRAPAGGNPDAYFDVTTTTNAITFTAHTNPNYAYDPSLGAINSLAVSIDFRNIASFGEGHGVSALLAQQNGNVFVAGSFITESTNFDWQNFSLAALDASDFSTHVGSGSIDLSTGGSIIQFGFETRNSGGNTINVGYDNWSLTLSTTPVPLPAGLPLLAAGLLLLVKPGGLFSSLRLFTPKNRIN